MLAFWILVIVGVIWLVAGMARGVFTGVQPVSTKTPATGQTPLDIVKARFANGETKDQFEETKRKVGA